MEISEEKIFIYSMIRDITAERRELTKIYYELQARLDALDRLETRGVEDLPIKGLVDLHNETDAKRIASNIMRVAEHTVSKIEKEVEEKINPPEKTVIPKVEIEAEKEKAAKKSVSTGKLSLDRVTGIIAHVLKEAGRPIAVADLYEVVNEKAGGQITRNNFRNNMLPRAAKRNPKINNISRGIYQYLNS